jgi:uncharacterized repeat protein (TIGR01451 family)
MKKILTATSILVFGAINGFSAGTIAGTQVDNSVTLNYKVGGTAQSAVVSNTASFVVDNKINLTVAHQDGSAVEVTPNSSDQILTFSVTNTGNKVQDFILSTTENDSNPFGETDNFDATGISIFVDANGNNVYDSATDTASFIDELSPDSSVSVFIVGDIGAQANGDVSEHTLTAQVAQSGSSGSKGTAITSDDSGSADTVMGVEIVFADGDGNGNTECANDGKHADNSAFKVVVATGDVSATKGSCVVSDPVNGTTNPKRIPGAIVRYTVEVTNNSATDSATEVVVTDTLQGDLAYSGNGVVADNACNCATPGASNGGSVTPSGGDVTMDFETVATSSTECAYFEVTIN